jgi:AcrR family transcriptional regulator
MTQSVSMREKRSVESERRVLDPKLPLDIGTVAQRQRIVDAMVEACAEKTFAGVTVADIVSGASISRTTFYKHFPDKQTCFDAALDFCVAQLRAVAIEAQAPGDALAEAICKATAAILELLAAYPSLAQFALGEVAVLNPTVLERYRDLAISALESRWLEAGEPRRGTSDPHLAFGRAQVLVFDQLARGRGKQLPELLPEIVYIALLPFAGHDEALQQARSTSQSKPSDGSSGAGVR